MKTQLTIAASLISITFVASPVIAAEPLEFQKVMKELGKNMQIITDGISREDWELVAKTALGVAQHPQPPMEEKTRIISLMGSEMPRFKSFDMKTHNAAHELELAANEKDGQKIIESFQKVQSSCLNCHQAFRAKFLKYFYGSSGK